MYCTVLLMLMLGSLSAVCHAGNEDFYTLSGSLIELQCNLKDGPVDSIIWSKNNKEFGRYVSSKEQWNNYRDLLDFDEENSCSTFSVERATFDDAGRYLCQAYYTEGGMEETWFYLTIYESPEMRNLTQLTNEGEQIFAQCCLQFAGKKMEPSFSWYLNENNKNQALEEVIVSRPQMENPNTSFCEVIEVTSHRRLHNQTIMCLMPKTSNRTNSGVLYVYYEPSVQFNSVEGTHESDTSISVEENQILTIECVAKGNPAPNVTLEGEDGKPMAFTLIQNETIGLLSRKVFQMKNVTRNASGLYVCQSGNRIGSMKVERQITITYPAVVLMTSPSTMAVKIYENFVIECKAESSPPAEVKLQKLVNREWILLPSYIPNKGNVSGLWQFYFRDVNPDVRGSYRCWAFNSKGKPATSLHVLVTVTHGYFHLWIASSLCVFILLVAGITTILFCRRYRRHTSFEMSQQSNTIPDVIRLNQHNMQPSSNSSSANVAASKSNQHKFSSKTPDRETYAKQFPKYYECYGSERSLSIKSYDRQENRSSLVGVELDGDGYATLNNQHSRQECEREQYIGVSE
ncbi:CD166 antigen-like [Apostichopus japonicus]|uniref:CD166 antigen-like n=1 Tax=Stichopus japonicus TaxID=307972 RepID=UPI003AB2B614